ncbi:heavy-metal-associated domain-containing protein [Neobacillus rhizosphaerae]|uniref:heavy-metal-associated domain-containing protein n=1 Tax=Neobacillus rhizosphaerae TaxID=2880965 RepID=UPI003D2A3CFA
METRVVTVKNMANQQDANKILKAIEHVWGITKAEVNLSKSQASFSFDEKMASVQDFEQAMIESGFEITNQEESK